MRRIISALLCMCLIMTSVCVTVFADETTSGGQNTITGRHDAWGGGTKVTNSDGTYTVTGLAGDGPNHIRYAPKDLTSEIGNKPVRIEIEFTLDKYELTQDYCVYIQLRDGKYTVNANYFNTKLQEGKTYKLNIAITKDLKYSATLNGNEITGTVTENASSTDAPVLIIGFYQPTDSSVSDTVTFEKPKAYYYSEDYTYAYNGKLATVENPCLGSHVATLKARNGDVLINNNASSYTYPAQLTYKNTTTAQPSFWIVGPNRYNRYVSGGEDKVKWIRVSFNIEPKITLGGAVRMSSLPGESTRQKVGTLEAGESYQIDLIHNLEDESAVIYNNGVKVFTGTLLTNADYNNTYTVFPDDMELTAGEVFAVINSAKYMEYSATQTLADFDKEMELQTKKGSKSTSIMLKDRGNTTITSADNGYDIVLKDSGTDAGMWMSIDDVIPFYTDATQNPVNIRFVRLHSDIKYDEYYGGYIEFDVKNGYSARTYRTLGQVVVGDGEEHSVDVLLDMTERRIYFYLDGVLGAEYDNRWTGSLEGTDGLIMFVKGCASGKSDKFSMKNNTATLYYDNEPSVKTINELKAIIETTAKSKVAVGGAERYLSGDIYKLRTGYAGFDKNAHLGIIAEYDADNNLIRATSMTDKEQDLTEDGSAKTIRVFIWDKTTLEPLADSVSAYIPE